MPLNSSALPSRRIDIQNLKNEMNLSLLVSNSNSNGTSAKELYWKTLKSFLLGKLSKTDYDKTMSMLLLNSSQRALHNEIVLAIYHNSAELQIAPPDDHGPWNGALNRRVSQMTNAAIGHTSSQLQEEDRKLRRAIMQFMTAKEREAFLRSDPETEGVSSTSEGSVSDFALNNRKPVFSDALFGREFSRGYLHATCVELSSLPDFSMLRTKMISIARQVFSGAPPTAPIASSGVRMSLLVTDDAVSFLSSALHFYIKSIISTCSKQHQLKQLHQNNSSSSSKSLKDANNLLMQYSSSDQSLIRTKDVYFSMLCRKGQFRSQVGLIGNVLHERFVALLLDMDE